MTAELSKYDELLSKLENLRFYISTPEQAANALIFAKRLRDFADFVETKVKTRASEIMSDKDLKFIEFGDFSIVKVEPVEVIEYNVSDLIEAVGIDRAKPFLKVSASKLKLYIKKQGVSMEELMIINRNLKKKHRDGYIKISEIKKKKDDNSKSNL